MSRPAKYPPLCRTCETMRAISVRQRTEIYLLRKELRKRTILTASPSVELPGLCFVCRFTWKSLTDETHSKGCIAAIPSVPSEETR
jgi:hypothetical protein